MSAKLAILLAAVLGATGVAAGAFGAHGLEKRVEPDQLAVFETGATYQMYHALALFGIGLLMLHSQSAATTVAGWSFFIGTLLFSGSLYAYVLTGSAIKWLPAITPFGGTLLIVGWVAVAVHAVCCWQESTG